MNSLQEINLFNQPMPTSGMVEFKVHTRESSHANELILESGRVTFSKNCKILFEAFMRGEIINTINSPVPEFRRRRQDLTDENGVRISLHSTDGRMKNWWMSLTDKDHNKRFIK